MSRTDMSGMNEFNPENSDSPTDNLEAMACTVQDKAQEAIKASQDYARENPAIVVIGALVFGVVIGILCAHREPKRKDNTQAACDLMDNVLSQISDRLPNFKKQASCPSSMLKECGQKLKWW